MNMANQFQDSLCSSTGFTVTCELVPGQGCGGKRVDRLLQFARQASADGRIRALSITDNPGGNPALAPVAIGTELLEIGIEPLIHFSLKDKNRSQVSSHIFLYQRLGLHSLLVLGGDFPKSGYYGQAKPVFDLDTIQTLQLMQDMENGSYPAQSGERQNNQPPPVLCKGCVVSPFKDSEAEQVWQYGKLLHKVRAGADFIISQLGFDLRKYQELITFLHWQKIDLPVLANLFIPSLPVARAMAAGKVPGVLLAEELVAQMEQEAAVNDKQARLDRAAAVVVYLKKIGYQGVHIGGNGLKFADIRYVLDKTEQLEQGKDTVSLTIDFPVRNSWYFFASKSGDGVIPSLTPLTAGSRPGAVKVHALSHRLLFTEQTFSGRLFGRFCRFIARGKGRTRFLYYCERFIKRLLFNCRMCGDCTLERASYLCPQSGCPKQLVNGPCGGSRKGFCEVFPERYCFWVRVYGRLDSRTTLADLTDFPALPPKNWALRKTSSWINYFSQ
jgi:methylenetetrahydrofolate reductase (NADPH)